MPWLDGGEICMELVTDSDADAAPRLHQVKPSFDALVSLYDQLLSAMRTRTAMGLVHGDLSPYHTLAADLDVSPRLVIIDVPQVVELASRDGAPAARLPRDGALVHRPRRSAFSATFWSKPSRRTTTRVCVPTETTSSSSLTVTEKDTVRSSR